jgi:hypothetical protein
VTYRLIETGAYQLARESLSANARVSLRYAEERIQANPHDPDRRRTRHDGATVDYSATGLLVAYTVLDSERIRLLDVVDVKKEHRWP